MTPVLDDAFSMTRTRYHFAEHIGFAGLLDPLQVLYGTPAHRPVGGLPCDASAGCGRVFGVDEAYEVVERRQVFDLPEPRLEITELRIGQIECCGVAHRGGCPAEVTAFVQYGAECAYPDDDAVSGSQDAINTP